MTSDRVMCRVKGKLPGNIDLIIRAFETQRSGYIHDLFLEWFEECQSTVVNIRVFGVDKVCSAPLPLLSSTGGLRSCVVCHNGLRTHEVLAGNRVQRLLSWGYPERAVVSTPSSPLPDNVVNKCQGYFPWERDPKPG